MKTTHKSLTERLSTINKRGNMFAVPSAILGLFISVTFIVTLLPQIIQNLTTIDVGGISGVFYTVILPLLIAFAVFALILKEMGVKGFNLK